MSHAADGVDGALRAVRQQIKMRTDWVKVCATGGASINTWDKQQFSDAELRCIIEEAHAKARFVAAHCVHAKGTLAAVREGVDTIEHGCNLTEETIDLMLKKGTYLVPTLYAPSALADRGTEYGFTQAAVETCRAILEPHQKSFKMALSAGIRIAFGTDAGYNPAIHGTNAYELQLLVENGMTPMDAILTATRNAASALRMDDKLGTIGSGKLADIVVVNGHPLEDIKILQDESKIAMVIKDGSIHVNRINQ
jgi:imidazolonepropionase-like amidohydrolase